MSSGPKYRITKAYEALQQVLKAMMQISHEKENEQKNKKNRHDTVAYTSYHTADFPDFFGEPY